jgi:glycosyltransferase involved in cell wall biosynthesis
MRILHAMHSMSPESGGPAEAVRRLAETAQRDGIFQVEFVTLDAPDKPYLKSETLTIHAVGPGRGKYGYTRRLDRWLSENLDRFDGVSIHGLWQYHGYSIWKACHERKPYIVFSHGMLDPWFKQAYPAKHRKKALYWAAIERRVLRDATAVIFTSPMEAELAPTTYRRSEWKSCTVPYGTMEPTGDHDFQIERFYEACVEVREKPFILFIGRLHQKKGCDLLIQAFARTAGGNSGLHLVIAGPDEERLKAELISLANETGVNDRVHFPGMLRGDAKWGAFHAAEVFALPSHQENFGVAVAEALACGTPVLISNQVNIWREIAEDSVGLVEADNLEGTTRLLERWQALSIGERVEMAARCLPSFQRRYNMRHVPRLLAELFSKAAQSSPTPAET